MRISEHGYDELAADGLTVNELLVGVARADVVEEYPDYPKGSLVLLLPFDQSGDPVHAFWGIPKGHNRPAVLVSARSQTVGFDVPEEGEQMTSRRRTKLIHEGRYAAEVDVELFDDQTGWAPYLSVADAQKLDVVREALRAGRVDVATQHGQVFELQPIVLPAVPRVSTRAGTTMGAER